MTKKSASSGASECCCCLGSGTVIYIGVCPLCDGAGRFESDASSSVQKLSNKAAKARAREISQSLSMLLRHTAREHGVAIDAQGWVVLDDALALLNTVDPDDPWEGGPVTVDEVRSVVSSSDKQRFALWEKSPLLIRASQGHTMAGIDADLLPVDLSEVPTAVHGSYYAAWSSVRDEGLKTMGRNHIHLARDLPGESGVISGMRSSCEILIWVDLVRAAAAGISFMQSTNGVILSEGADGTITPEFFSKVIDRWTNVSLL